MIRLLGISGSLRKDSYNTALLRAAQALAPEGVALEIATLHGIPLYDGDEEAAHGVPEAARALKEQVVACDGLLLCTPEYNNGIPGVFKNAVDWLSRPNDDIPRVFGGRPVAVLGATPSGFGTLLAQAAWLPVLRLLGAQPWLGAKVMVSRAHKAFDADGALADEAAREQLRAFVEGFADFAGRQRKA